MFLFPKVDKKNSEKYDSQIKITIFQCTCLLQPTCKVANVTEAEREIITETASFRKEPSRGFLQKIYSEKISKIGKRLCDRCFSVTFDNFFKSNTIFETTWIFSIEKNA